MKGHRIIIGLNFRFTRQSEVISGWCKVRGVVHTQLKVSNLQRALVLTNVHFLLVEKEILLLSCHVQNWYEEEFIPVWRSLGYLQMVQQ